MEPAAAFEKPDKNAAEVRASSRLGQIARQHPLPLFFVLAYTWAWPIALCIVYFDAPIELSIPVSFGPTIAAVCTHRLAEGNYRAFSWYGNWRRLTGGAFTAITLTLLAFVVIPGILLSEDPRKLNWAILVSSSVYNYSTLLGGPLGEEPGWRGYALPRLEAWVGPFRASLVLGGLWTAWHLPLFWAEQWHAPPFGIYLILIMSLCVILNFSANVSRFAVIPAVLGHAAFNTVSQYISGLFSTAEMTSSNAFWRALGKIAQSLGASPFAMSANLVVALCGAAVALLVIGATRGRLGFRDSRDDIL
jgi:membrane protease YdiL (CAAX protease family)